MLKSAICRALSEALEPMPAPLAYRDLRLVSPLGFWKWDLDGGGWIAVNYFTSEDASARLLDAMPCPRVGRSNDSKLWFCRPLVSPIIQTVEHADRKTAIVLAACKWLKIDVDTIED